MNNDNVVYSKIGMALISAQRVEFVTSELLNHLNEFDETLYHITSEEFLSTSKKAIQSRMMLGEVFKLLKLNPKLVIEEELNEYLKLRNLFVHSFWKTYLNTNSPEQQKVAIEFCDNFGKVSQKVESFFKGFIYFLMLRHMPDRTQMPPQFKKWERDFDLFITSPEPT